MALHGGVLNSYGDRVWLDSGDTSSFKTYEDFEAAVKRQLDYLIDVNCRGTVIIEKVFRDVSPHAFYVPVRRRLHGKGRDVMDGGAVLYAGPGTIFCRPGHLCRQHGRSKIPGI